ncbi:hypothetical protein ALC57_16404 [Trachymyrmex cornetzi]|uniref:Uncharacterized protein n=1 Tax=Trachymyrmex cornetzi TaxID=471704 RepID=A0A151IV64_9HYME|nr:hypothetical protein ALC57_16404 [Trachymyrmex cornetzi]
MWIHAADGRVTNPPYQIERFNHNPGIYFEKIRKLLPIEGYWKLVIKTDTTSLAKRANQLQEDMRTKQLCQILLAGKESCKNLYTVLEKEHNKIQQLVEKVALSRVRSLQDIKIYLGKQRENRLVKNYVYKEMFV